MPIVYELEGWWFAFQTFPGSWLEVDVALHKILSLNTQRISPMRLLKYQFILNNKMSNFLALYLLH